MSELHLETPDAVGATFGFAEEPGVPAAEGATDFAAHRRPGPPSLLALAPFTGTFVGKGFNTIFRPDNRNSPSELPPPAVKISQNSPRDNVLELNLTDESLCFMPPLGKVANRGEIQGDITFNGVPYLQTIADITDPAHPGGTIHVEPGVWVILPHTEDPQEPGTVVRMASIPHGTTITAQGGSSVVTLPQELSKQELLKIIPAINITPFNTNDPRDVIPPEGQRGLVPFDSQTATLSTTARIPQDLGPYIAARTITADMLNDPATFIRNHLEGQLITSMVKLTVDTKVGHLLFGGGVLNIAFLLGDPQANDPNAQAVNMTATFWIETVEYTLQVPAFQPGQPPLKITPDTGMAGQPVPCFLVDPPVPVPAPRTIKATATQIQYAQQVFLNFNGLTWPHVSVATLVPKALVPVPASAWT